MEQFQTAFSPAECILTDFAASAKYWDELLRKITGENAKKRTPKAGKYTQNQKKQLYFNMFFW